MLKAVDLNRLVDFVKIIDFGNITRAAEGLGEPKAKLSRSLALLESELNVQLVYRTTRQFQLTDAGRELYRNAKPQLAELESALHGISHQKEKVEGLLRVTAADDIGSHLVTPLVAAFRRQYPSVDFELIYTNEYLDLVKLGVDLAFRVGNLKDSSMIRKVLGKTEMILVASPEYLAKAPALESLSDLAKHETIAFTGGDPGIWKFTSKSGTQTVKVKPRLHANHFPAIRDLALQHFGVAFVPRFLCERPLASGDLVSVLKSMRSEGFPLQIVMPGGKNPPLRIKRFFEFAAREFPKHF